MLGDMHFLDSLKEYDKDNIPAPIMKKIRDRYTVNPDFNPDIIQKVSSACEGLCKWVRAMEVYDRIAKVIIMITQQTQNICITFIQCWNNVEDVGQMFCV